MKRNKSTTEFWPVLAAVNILALTYPINLLIHAESTDEHLFAAFALVGFVFLLAVVDAVSIVVVDVVGTGSR